MALRSGCGGWWHGVCELWTVTASACRQALGCSIASLAGSSPPYSLGHATCAMGSKGGCLHNTVMGSLGAENAQGALMGTSAVVCFHTPLSAAPNRILFAFPFCVHEAQSSRSKLCRGWMVHAQVAWLSMESVMITSLECSESFAVLSGAGLLSLLEQVLSLRA